EIARLASCPGLRPERVKTRSGLHPGYGAMPLARGAHAPGWPPVVLFTMSNSAVSRSRGAFLVPGVSLSLCFLPLPTFFVSLPFLRLLSRLPRIAAGCVASFPLPHKGSAERRQAHGCRVSTRCACHDRHAGHHERRRAPERRGLASGAPPWRFLVRATHC